jgi:hypothetical protein
MQPRSGERSQPTAQAVGKRKVNGSKPPEGRKKVYDTNWGVHPFKCGNNSLNAAEDEDRINS